jgi:flotillin
MTALIVVAALTLAVVIFFVFYTLKNLLLVATPNQVLVLAGSVFRTALGEIGYRAIRGGRAVRVPLLEQAHWLDLSNIPVEIEVRHAFSKGGIPLNVQGVAHVKLPGDGDRLANAVERFLGRSRVEIAQIARETLEGNVRGVLSQLTPEQVNEDKIAFEKQLLEEAEHDMVRMGLELDTLKIQNVTDDANYLNSIGRIRGAKIRRDARIAEARAQAEAAMQKAENWSQSEFAKIRADLAIAREEATRRRTAATSSREARIAEARGKAQAEIARTEEDTKRQAARAAQVAAQLDADVVKPCDAERRKMEEAARAEAARIVERGRAQAEALGRLLAEYRAAGPAAREVLVLQQLMPMLEAISGAHRKTRIREWTVLPNDGAEGGLAQRAVQLSEQLRAGAGIDVPALLSRIGAATPVSDRPAPPLKPPPKPEKR